MTKPTLDVVPDEEEEEGEEGEEEESVPRVNSNYLSARMGANGGEHSACNLATTSPGGGSSSSTSGLSSGTGLGGSSPISQSSASSLRQQRGPSPPEAPNSAHFSGTNTANNGRLEAKKRVDDDEQMHNIDSGHSDGSSLCEERDSSPVARKISYLNKGLGRDDNNLETRDNLAKTGAILAELEKFDEDSTNEHCSSVVGGVNDDDSLVERKAACDMDKVDNREKDGSAKVNESELVLEPKRMGGQCEDENNNNNGRLAKSNFEWYGSNQQQLQPGKVTNGYSTFDGVVKSSIVGNSLLSTINTDPGQRQQLRKMSQLLTIEDSEVDDEEEEGEDVDDILESKGDYCQDESFDNANDKVSLINLACWCT